MWLMTACVGLPSVLAKTSNTGGESLACVYMSPAGANERGVQSPATWSSGIASGIKNLD